MRTISRVIYLLPSCEAIVAPPPCDKPKPGEQKGDIMESEYKSVPLPKPSTMKPHIASLFAESIMLNDDWCNDECEFMNAYCRLQRERKPAAEAAASKRECAKNSPPSGQQRGDPKVALFAKQMEKVLGKLDDHNVLDAVLREVGPIEQLVYADEILRLQDAIDRRDVAAVESVLKAYPFLACMKYPSPVAVMEKFSSASSPLEHVLKGQSDLGIWDPSGRWGHTTYCLNGCRLSSDELNAIHQANSEIFQKLIEYGANADIKFMPGHDRHRENHTPVVDTAVEFVAKLGAEASCGIESYGSCEGGKQMVNRLLLAGARVPYSHPVTDHYRVDSILDHLHRAFTATRNHNVIAFGNALIGLRCWIEPKIITDLKSTVPAVASTLAILPQTEFSPLHFYRDTDGKTMFDIAENLGNGYVTNLLNQFKCDVDDAFPFDIEDDWQQLKAAILREDYPNVAKYAELVFGVPRCEFDAEEFVRFAVAHSRDTDLEED